jgi:hypothetical protein
MKVKALPKRNTSIYTGMDSGGPEERGDIKIILPRLYPAQLVVRQQARRFNMICCGRRWGKTTMSVNLIAETILAGHPAGWFAPNYKLLTEAWRDITERLAPLQSGINSQEKRVEYMTGGVLEFWSLENKRVARSRKYRRVIIDEAAFHQHLDTTWRKAIRPTLADLKGDAWFISTPDGRNAFYRMWSAAQDQHNWYTVRRSSYDNPFIDPAELDELRSQLTEREYLQEILAQFVSEDGSVFRNVTQTVMDDVPDVPQPNVNYVFGVDWGRTNDATVFVVLDMNNKQVVAVDRMVKTGFDLQVGRLQNLFDKWKPQTIIAETNSIGLPMLERLQRMNMPVRGFTTTNASKAEIIEKLSLAIEKQEIGLLRHEILLQELIAYTQERTPGGLIKYGAPIGEHDDCVMALALAWHGVSNAAINLLQWYRDRNAKRLLATEEEQMVEIEL